LKTPLDSIAVSAAAARNAAQMSVEFLDRLDCIAALYPFRAIGGPEAALERRFHAWPGVSGQAGPWQRRTTPLKGLGLRPADRRQRMIARFRILHATGYTWNTEFSERTMFAGIVRAPTHPTEVTIW